MSNVYMVGKPIYEDTLGGGCHWSMRVKKGTLLTLTDVKGGANVGMLFYNPYDLLEKYNAPDTLKCQHTQTDSWSLFVFRYGENICINC